MVKASSVITAIADDLTGTDSRALFLHVPLARYIETILAGEASMAETLAQAPARMARLATLLPDFPHALWQLPPVTRVAMSRSEEHTSELQPLMRISYAVFCLHKKTQTPITQ